MTTGPKTLIEAVRHFADPDASDRALYRGRVNRIERSDGRHYRTSDGVEVDGEGNAK